MARHTSFGDNWKLEKKDSEVSAYTTTVPGSEFRAYKIEAIAESTLTGIIAHQKDAANFPKWMDGVKSSECFKDTGDAYYTHSIAPAPWPVKDRDSVVESLITQDPDTLEVNIRFTAKNELRKPVKGCERVATINGEWIFIPILENGNATGKVKVAYINHVNPGGKVPGWLANNFAIDVPFNTIKGLLKVVKEPQYQKATMDFIKEP
ncbi:MAG: START domain-containing protein [Pseudomonadales bacterium]|nr:START domain-containing protein [Pseudomonadales bacterium]